jgi:hypothetical protein
MPKEAVFTVKLEADLRDAFAAEAAATHRPASDLVRAFMREFVQRQREAREHDAWFRAKVQEAINDPRPGISHDVVMDETRTIIDRIVADKRKADKTIAHPRSSGKV